MIDLEKRYRILTHLNFALVRSYEMRGNYENFDGDLWQISATLNPAEYRANRPQPLLFEKEDIWQRLDKIESESQYLEAQILEILQSLDEVEGSLRSVRSNDNYALKKADVLEWDVGLKTSGIKIERDDLIEKLRILLSLPPTPSRHSGTNLEYG